MIDALRSAIERMQIKREELGSVLHALTRIEQDALVALSQGIYMPAKLTDTQTFIVGVSRTMLVEKSREELIDYIQRKIRELEASIAANTEHYYRLIEEHHV